MTDRTPPPHSASPETVTTKVVSAAYLALAGIAMAAWIAFLAWIAWRLFTASF